MSYQWTSDRYEFKLSYNQSDSGEDWYSLWVYDLTDATGNYIESLRFPTVPADQQGVAGWASTWTEVYFKATEATPVPGWHVSIDEIVGIDLGRIAHHPTTVKSVYSNIENTDTYYDASTGKIHFLVGPNVVRGHPAGILY